MYAFHKTITAVHQVVLFWKVETGLAWTRVVWSVFWSLIERTFPLPWHVFLLIWIPRGPKQAGERSNYLLQKKIRKQFALKVIVYQNLSTGFSYICLDDLSTRVLVVIYLNVLLFIFGEKIYIPVFKCKSLCTISTSIPSTSFSAAKLWSEIMNVPSVPQEVWAVS